METVAGEQRSVGTEERAGAFRDRGESQVFCRGVAHDHSVHLARPAGRKAAQEPWHARWGAHVGRARHDDPHLWVHLAQRCDDRNEVAMHAPDRRQVSDVVCCCRDEHDVGANLQREGKLIAPNVGHASAGDAEVRHHHAPRLGKVSRGLDRDAALVVPSHSGGCAVAEHDISQWRTRRSERARRQRRSGSGNTRRGHQRC